MDISGDWYNELGSMMTLEVYANGLRGTYHTAVGDASGQYDLVGYVDDTPESTRQAVGFCVLWKNASGDSESATTWCGEFQQIVPDDGSSPFERIVTTWLLASETSPNQDWKSTIVGRDFFWREQPSEARVKDRRARSAWPHPA
jgi:Avidin family